MTSTVLLIEDHFSVATPIHDVLLAEIADDIVCVTTVDDALIELGSRSAACVVLDLRLAAGDGLELIDTLLAAHRDVPIVVMTGADDDALAVEVIRRGAQDCLSQSQARTGMVGRAVTFAIERARILAALAQTESQYRTVIETLGEGVVVQSAGGRIQIANASAARILGLTIDEVLDSDVTDPTWRAIDEHYKSLTGECHPLTVALKTGKPVVDLTMGVRLPAGGRRWLEVSAFPSNNGSDAAPDAVVFSMRDITDTRAVMQQAQFQANLLDAAGQAIIATSVSGAIIYWNRAAEQHCGWSAEEALGRNLLQLVSTPGMVEVAEHTAAELTAGRTWTGDFRVRRRDGTTFPAFVTDTPFIDESGQVTAILIVATDITERERSEEAVRRLSAIVESSGDAIIGETLDGTIVSWNRGAENLFGYTADEVIDRSLGMLVSDTYRAGLPGLLQRVADSETEMRLETVGRHKDGAPIDLAVTVSPVYGNDGVIVGCSAIARDITARVGAQRALAHQALHDSLTGLPNRVLLDDRIEQALVRARAHDGRVAVLVLDLDEFKLVNDGLGHLAGDELLVAVAHRLTECVRPDDTVARFGGDEFVIVCDAADPEMATQLGNRVLEVLQAPFSVQGMDIFVTASIGLVIADLDANPDGLLRDADAAMYQAKQRGRSRLEMFDQELRDRAASKLQSAAELRRALHQRELEVFYQPVVAIADGRPLGVEALLRWRHPEHGLVSPADFIPLAEETGMIVPIGRWVLQEALRQRASWEAELPGQARLQLSVNLSARQLSEPTLVDDVSAALVATSADPSSLVLEITESVLMHDSGWLSTLNAIHSLGVALHVDDFGTGYSSLAYLKTLPVDVLKIDRAFIDDLGADADDRAIITAIIALARALSLGVVAEGVETETQLEVLRELGCDRAQGYLFARPMPYDQLVAWLRDRVLCASTQAV
jgi:diguanylate cyclase (GGDEF)-like protein/PAS domain S-box-containing protein